jgi:hypothetical protein
MAVKRPGLAGPQLDLGAARERAATGPAREQRRQMLVAVGELREQPPRRVVQEQLGRQSLAHDERRPGDLQPGQGLLKRAFAVLAVADLLDRDREHAGDGATIRRRLGLWSATRSRAGRSTRPPPLVAPAPVATRVLCRAARELI